MENNNNNNNTQTKKKNGICISDYIIAQMITHSEKERNDFDYQDILSLIDEEFNTLYLNNKDTPDSVNYENLIQMLESQTCQELKNQQEKFASDESVKLNAYFELIYFSKLFKDDNYMQKLCYNTLSFIENELTLTDPFVVKKQNELQHLLIQIHTNKAEYKQSAHWISQMIMHPMNLEQHDSIDSDQTNLNLRQLLNCYDLMIKNKIQFKESLEDIEAVQYYINTFKQMITDYEQTYYNLEGYKCKAYYDSGNENQSNLIFNQIQDKIDTNLKNILKSQYVEHLDIDKFDPSEWETEKAIDILENFKKLKKKDTHKFVEIELKIADINLSIPNYDEALHKLENANCLISQFYEEVFVDQISVLEKMADVCMILKNERKRKHYMVQAMEIAHSNQDIKSKQRLKAKYKTGEPNLLLQSNNNDNPQSQSIQNKQI